MLFSSAKVNELGNHLELRTLDAAVIGNASVFLYGEDVETVAMPP